MNKRRNKKLINTIKTVRDNGDCNKLLKFFDGRWVLLANYLDWLIDNGFITYTNGITAITDKSIDLLLKTKCN